jgi:hypothetical protein
MAASAKNSGFAPPARRALGQERRTVALAEVIAIVALALSTIVVATVVSVGIARADVVNSVVGHESSVFAIALLLGLLFVAMGGLTIFSLPHRPKKQ